MERWQRAHGVAGDAEELARHPALREAIAREVARVNDAVSRPEQVRKFAIIPHDLTVEAGEITPTHKVRRAVVATRYAALVDAMYRESA